MNRVFGTLLFLFVLSVRCAGDDWLAEAPPTAYRTREVDADWRAFGSLGLSVQLAGEPPATPLLLSFYIQTAEGIWIESRRDLTLDGTPQRFDLSLQDDSVDWRIVNGDRLFGRDLLRRVERWGLRLYAADPWEGVIRVGDLEKRSLAEVPESLYRPRELPGSVAAGSLAELSVEPWYWSGDAFDPATAPRLILRGDGEPVERPMAWVQEYRSRRFPGRLEPEWLPWRRPVFRALWRPEGEGEYEVALRHSGGDQVLGTVRVTAPEAADEERRPASERFYHSLETETVWKSNGEGNWIPAEVAGIWTPELDWTDAWGLYAGLGDFAQPEAARFEREVRQSAESGPLLIVSEHVLDDRTRLNWRDHPWNAANGGAISDPRQMWTRPAWHDLALRRAHYLWARYGAYPNVTGLYIDVERASPAHVFWIEDLRRRLREALPGVDVFCPSAGLPERREGGPLAGAGREAWIKPDLLPGAERFIQTGQGMKTVLVGASDQGFDAANLDMRHWSDAEALRLDVEPHFSEGVFPSLQVQVRTAPDRVFTSPVLPLHNREINRLFVPLDDPEGWTCFQEPGRAWTPLERMNIREVLLRVYSDTPDPSASFIIHDARTVSHPLALRASTSPLEITAFEPPGDKALQLDLLTWRLELDRFFHNPYDAEEIAVDLEVVLPDGRTVSHPGFFHQQADRSFENGVEEWTLTENTDWRVRFRPWLAGKHDWTLVVRHRPTDGGEERVLRRNGHFTASERSGAKGFVRQSTRDPRFLEFQNGDFFYPIGHTMRSPTDRRPGIYEPDLMATLDAADAMGTEIYRRWFERLAEHGGNFARVWISNWWLGLEWNSRHTGYHGRKYFNQENAARLDRLIELAEVNGVYLNIETTNHGTFSSTIDGEWEENPWSAFSPDAGPVTYASEFFLNEEAVRWHRLKLRYLMARVGHSPSVAFYGVLTESEWTEAYFRSFRDERNSKPHQPKPFRSDRFRQPFKDWVDETAKDLVAINAHPTLASTHFSNPHNGLDFWRLDSLKVVYNNAYSGFYRRFNPDPLTPERLANPGDYPAYDERRDPWEGIVRDVLGYEAFFRPHARDDKILLIGEWGGRATRNIDSHLVAEFHSGGWAMVMSNLSGVSGYWWFNLADFYDLFPRYRAIARFMEGEDLRERDFDSARLAVRFPNAKQGEHRRLAVGKFTDTDLFAYVYSEELSDDNRSQPARGFQDRGYPETGQGWLAVPDRVKDGVYRLECYNTFTGEVFEERTVQLSPRTRELALPSHRVDLALKLRFLRELPPPTPTPLPTPTPTPAPTPTPTPVPPTPTPEPTPEPVVPIPAPRPPPDL